MNYIFIVLFIINLFFLFYVIFKDQDNKNPAITWCFIMVMLLFPTVGFMFYLIFGLDAKKHTVFAKKYVIDEKLSEQIYNLKYKGLDFLDSSRRYITLPEEKKAIFSNYCNILNLNANISNSSVSVNNEIKPYHLGEDKINDLIIDIRNAKKYIHMQYYIFRNDITGNQIVDELVKRAEEGIEVKLLLDGMSNFYKSKKRFKKIVKAGGAVNLFVFIGGYNVNFRNHRKVSIIDGEICYIGGLNIGDEYLGRVKRYGHWRDSHVRIIGDAAKSCEIKFIKDWNFCCKTENDKIQLNEFYFPYLDQNISTNVFTQLVTSGPDTKYASIHLSFCKLINDSISSVYIVTPYFVPDDSLIVAIKGASLRGVKIKILIPKNPDHIFVFSASMSFLFEILNDNVEFYLYEKGFIHSKLIIVDNNIVSVGSANFDIRSFNLNFETNAFIFNESLATNFINKIELDIINSVKVDEVYLSNMSWVDKFKQSIARLISPLL